MNGNRLDRFARWLNKTVNFSYLWIIFILQLLSCAAIVFADELLEHQVKVAYIHKILKFVIWPGQQDLSANKDDANNILICYLGEEGISNVLFRLQNLVVNDKTLKVHAVTSEKYIDICNVLVIVNRAVKDYTRVINAYREKSILTISDIPGFTSHGGMVGFTLKNDKVKMEINYNRVKNAKIKLSSKLLDVVEIVTEK